MYMLSASDAQDDLNEFIDRRCFAKMAEMDGRGQSGRAAEKQ